MAENNKKIDWKKVTRLALILLLITVAAACCLALTNAVTKEIIAGQKLKRADEAKAFVMPDADAFETMDAEAVKALAEKADPETAEMVSEIAVAKKDGQPIGVVIKTTPSGYGGEIELLTGLMKDGTISGITFLSLKETAGLGMRADQPEFKEQYIGLKYSDDNVIDVVKNGGASGNDINAIAGATVTSKAVTKGVNIACRVFEELKGGLK